MLFFSGEKSTYEMDFLIQKGKNVIPLELKAEQNLKAKSLKVFCEKFTPALAVRTSMANYCQQEMAQTNLINIPLWTICGV